MPTHDRLELLRLAVASVLAQTERSLELIVVDDASSDGTPEFLAEVAPTDPRIVVIRNDVSKGGAGSRNVGIAVSRGAWVAFLDDDDEWAPSKLERQLQILRAAPAAVACTCAYLLERGRGAVSRQSVPMDVTLRELLAGERIGGASMCICSGAVLRQIGGFDVGFASGQDLDLWVRLRQQGRIAGCPEALVTHRYHGGVRITTNMRAQYLGARRFYFKHRGLMDESLRRQRLAFSCYIMSRQPTRGFRFRGRFLWLSVRSSAARTATRYALSGGLRLIRDILRRRRTGRPGTSAPATQARSK